MPETVNSRNRGAREPGRAEFWVWGLELRMWTSGHAWILDAGERFDREKRVRATI